LHVAFHVPLPSKLAVTFEMSFASGRHPVCPALTIFNLVVTMGALADGEAQPVAIAAVLAMMKVTRNLDANIVTPPEDDQSNRIFIRKTIRCLRAADGGGTQDPPHFPL
jgi:hypothetical protein